MTHSLPTLSMRLPVPISSLESYITYVNQVPMLTQEQELALATRLQEQNDLDAAKQLVMPHARYVVKVAKNYMGYGLPLADLIQEGNIGLMKAVKRFNPKMGVRLVTFAIHWIKSEIHEFVLRNWRIVKVATTKAQRKLFFNLRSAKKQLTWFTKQEVEDVAKDLGVKPETVREMEMRMHSSDASLEAHFDDDNYSDVIPTKYLEDNRYNPSNTLEASDWSDQANAQLHEALVQLDSRSQEIVRARWLNDDKLTLQELADKFQVSAERVRQLEKMAMQKLKRALVAVAA